MPFIKGHQIGAFCSFGACDQMRIFFVNQIFVGPYLVKGDQFPDYQTASRDKIGDFALCLVQLALLLEHLIDDGLGVIPTMVRVFINRRSSEEPPVGERSAAMITEASKNTRIC
jgi:hypothetical protein